MTIKILGGEFKGRFLQTPKGPQTRPTMSMVRKAVFDILQPHIEGALFLDLFCGSGAVGIEALSRGAKKTFFIDSHKEAIRALQKNITLLQIEQRTHIIQDDAFKALKKLQGMRLVYDIIYVDPPYDRSKLYQEVLKFFDTGTLMTPETLLFMESPYPSPLEEQIKGLRHLKSFKSRKYGASEIYQFTFLP